MSTDELGLGVLQNRQADRVRRLGSSNEILNALTCGDDRAVSLASRAERIQNLRSQDGISKHRPNLIENENVKVFTYTGAAVVIGTYHTKGNYKGRPFEHWGRFTDTWVFEKNAWLCVGSHTSLIKK